MPDHDTTTRVKRVLRECLKLDPDAPIPDDMPLVGGEYDLDSLDILLVVTSMEKEFAITIPNQSVGRAAFATVATLTDFVEARRRGEPAA